MKNIHSILCIAAAALIASTSLAEEIRAWTSKANGQQFRGALVSVEGDTVSIRRESDNVTFQVKKEALTQGDVDWIEQNAMKMTTKPPSGGEVEDLSELISGVPAEMGTPAVAALLIKEGEIRGLGVAGVRVAGGKEAVELEDKWHLGSCTKSMTSTLAATLVEEGAITWDTTVAEVLGKEMKMLKDYEPVTLGMLLANRSGITGSAPDSVYGGVEIRAQVKDLSDRDILKQRAAYVEAVLNLKPSTSPNTAYEYSNSGFVVAGAMLERVAGKPWEKLIEERIFKPLGMVNSGFGSAAHEDKRKPTQPWPHKNGTTPVPPGYDDNPWVIGPAGTVHCSLKDVARYIAMHANREIGPVLKKPESFVFLHTALPDNNDYARGWIVTQTGWSKGPAISHDGSNTMNHCSFWIAPEAGAAVAAFTNCGDKGSESCRAVIKAVVAKHLE